MKLAATLVALSLAVPAVAAAAPQTWKIVADVGGRQYHVSCALEVDGGMLSGPCTSDAMTGSVQSSGTYTDTTSQLAYDVTTNGQKLHVVYNGQAQPDGTYKGTVDASGSAGTFTASQ